MNQMSPPSLITTINPGTPNARPHPEKTRPANPHPCRGRRPGRRRRNRCRRCCRPPAAASGAGRIPSSPTSWSRRATRSWRSVVGRRPTRAGSRMAASSWRWRPRTGPPFLCAAIRLQEELARLYPEAVKDGQIDLLRFRDREAASRGLGDWIWHKVSALRLDRDMRRWPGGQDPCELDGAGGSGMGVATKAYGFMRLGGSRTKTSQRYNARCESPGLSRSRITLAILRSNPLRLLSSTRSFRIGGRACSREYGDDRMPG